MQGNPRKAMGMRCEDENIPRGGKNRRRWLSWSLFPLPLDLSPVVKMTPISHLHLLKCHTPIDFHPQGCSCPCCLLTLTSPLGEWSICIIHLLTKALVSNINSLCNVTISTLNFWSIMSSISYVKNTRHPTLPPLTSQWCVNSRTERRPRIYAGLMVSSQLTTE